MKSIVYMGLLAAFAQCVSASSVSLAYPHVPLAMWSDRKTYHGSNIYLSDTLDEGQLAYELESVSKGKSSILTSSTSSAEILCVFLRKNLRIDDFSTLGSSSFIQNAVETSTSSIVVPHTTRSYSLQRAMDFDIPPKVASIDEVESFAKSTEGKTLLSDGKTDILIVEIPDTYSMEETDDLVAIAAKSLSIASNNLVDFVFTGDEGEATVMTARRLAEAETDAKSKTDSDIAADLFCAYGLRKGLVNGVGFCFGHHTYMTPDILAGILFGLFFVFLSFIGFGVLNEIQTPLRYPHQGAPVGKEF